MRTVRNVPEPGALARVGSPSFCSTLEEITTDLERTTALDRAGARSVLERARLRLETLADDPAVDDERRAELERRVDQRLRTVRDRDAYEDTRLGAAMNPDDEDVP